MKIILCLHQFFPRWYTGTESLTLSVALELRKKGHEVIILTYEPIIDGDLNPEKPEIRKDQYEEITVYRIVNKKEENYISLIRKEAENIELTQLYERILEETKPDIVHIFHLMRLTKSLIDVLKSKRVPVFFTATDFWLLCPKYQMMRYDNEFCKKTDPRKCFSCLLDLICQKPNKKNWKLIIGRKYPNLASIFNNSAKKAVECLKRRIEINKVVVADFDYLFWPNSFMKKLFAENGFVSKNEMILEFPIPSKCENIFDIDEPKYELPLNIAFIGSLQPSKGPEVIIKAIKNTDRSLKIKLKIYGDSIIPGYKEHLIDISKNDERIKFKGIFPQEKLKEIFEKIDVLVIPSIWYENTPLIALSALAAKRLLLVSDVEGLTCLIKDKINGYVFKRGDYKNLSAIIESLVMNHEKLSNMTKLNFKPNKIDAYVNQILNVYYSKINN